MVTVAVPFVTGCHCLKLDKAKNTRGKMETKSPKRKGGEKGEEKLILRAALQSSTAFVSLTVFASTEPVL